MMSAPRLDKPDFRYGTGRTFEERDLGHGYSVGFRSMKRIEPTRDASPPVTVLPPRTTPSDSRLPGFRGSNHGLTGCCEGRMAGEDQRAAVGGATYGPTSCNFACRASSPAGSGRSCDGPGPPRRVFIEKGHSASARRSGLGLSRRTYGVSFAGIIIRNSYTLLHVTCTYTITLIRSKKTGRTTVQLHDRLNGYSKLQKR